MCIITKFNYLNVPHLALKNQNYQTSRGVEVVLGKERFPHHTFIHRDDGTPCLSLQEKN